MGITPSDKVFGLSDVDRAELDGFLSGNKLRKNSKLSKDYNVYTLLKYLLGSKLVTVYTAADMASLYRMFMCSSIIWGGNSKDIIQGFITHMENLSVKLGFDKGYLRVLGSNQYKLFAELQKFYGLNGVGGLVNTLWPVPGTCLLPSPYFINMGLQRASTVGAMV